MPTTPVLWPLQGLLAAKQATDGVRLDLPKYQRGLVWDKERRSELIRSIYQGYPIGALLLGDSGDHDGLHTYTIVDGLQRTDTICEHLSQPLASAPREVLPEKELALLAGDLTAVLDLDEPVDVGLLRESMLTWLHEVKELKAAKGFTWSALLRHLLEGLSLRKPSEEATLENRLNEIIDQIRTRIDVSGYQVPVLIHSGDQGQLPEIFEKLNSQGTALSKYQIYAASWSTDSEVAIKNKCILKSIEDRYSSMEEKGYSLEDEDAPPNLFDYLFGLSEVLAQKFPRLFRASGTPSDAFSLATLVRGQPLSRMNQLPRFVSAPGERPLDIAVLEKRIFEAAKFVDEALAPFLGVELSKEARVPAHSELQIVSIVAGVIGNLWNSSGDWTPRPGAASKRKRLRRAIPQHYLLDIIRKTWRGPLYTVAYQRVWSSPDVPSGFYLEAPPRSQWDSALDIWFEEQLSERDRRRPNVSAADKAILKFVYSDIVTAYHLENRMDVEHLFPVKRLLDMTTGDTAYPIGAIANLALLDRETNRRKKSETIAELFARRRGTGANRPLKRVEKGRIEPLLLCSPTAVRIPQRGGDDALSIEEYQQFLSSRWRTMRDKLYEALDVGDR